MEQIHHTVAVAAAVVFLVGLVSRPMQRLPLSVPLLAFAAGIAAGPVGLGWLLPEAWAEPSVILREAARFAVAVSVMSIALRTPAHQYRAMLRPVAILLTLGMAAMWAVASGLSWAILGLSPLMALALGATVTPTDPVVASSIVTGGTAEASLPGSLRSAMSLESGANDGLGYALVTLPLALLGSAGWGGWLAQDVLIGVGLAVLIGAALGGGLGLALRLAGARGWVTDESLLNQAVALALAALALVKIAGSDGILAAFAAGAAFRFAISAEQQDKKAEVQETVSKLLSIPVFVVFGAALPWAGWAGQGAGATLLFAAAVLLLRRPVALLLVGPLLGAGLRRRDAAFMGWFGPVGVASLYYAMLVSERTGDQAAWHGASAVIAASIVLHGLTSALGMRLYRRAAAC